MTSHSTQPNASSGRLFESSTIDGKFRCLAVCLALVGATAVSRPIWWPTTAESILQDSAALLSAERYAAAESRAREMLQRDARSSRALIVAGEAAIRQERNQDAIRLFQQVQEDGSADSVHALYRAGERLMATGNAREAEKYLRTAVDHDAGHSLANKKLALLLQLQGRTWESVPFVRRVLLNGDITKDNLLMVSATDTTFVEDDQFIRNCLECDANYSAVLLVQARQALTKSRMQDAEQLLRLVIAKQPSLVEAQARIGRILLEKGAEPEFLEWRRKLPPESTSHPEIWHTQGLWARRNGQLSAAIRCFLEAARLDPNHKGAVLQLSQLLKNTEHSSIAEQLSERSQQLSQLHYLLMEVRFGYDSQLAKKIVDLLDQLHRELEAAGWCQILKLWSPDNHAWCDAKLAQLHSQIELAGDLTGKSGHLIAHIDPKEFPLPRWPKNAIAREEPVSAKAVDGEIHFTDVASEVGIEFQYFNGTTSQKGLTHILQATGGGVAVIDYDLDGWPDLYFIQSGPFPIEAKQTKYTNRLYRNLGNDRFQDVTEATGLADASYGQGVAVGDYNNDGFPDLYVANFGRNRLYENTGTGEFLDVTERANVAGDHWSTSCMIADLNGDSLPEIYAVTYALKDQVLELNCEYEGRPRTCAPTLLTAEQDILYGNRGDGTFEDVTKESGIIAPDGKGLAVIAADFEHKGQLDLFIANDTSANFFFRNEATGPGKKPSFREEAIGLGVGFDEVGNPQACMGLTAADANGDGLLDMFVTNFYGESNTLYLQLEDHSFTDATRKANLRDSSFNMLGFGAQFLDGELDGWPDLIMTNGHIDFTFAHGNPDRMPPQYVRNVGQGRFVELTSASLGPYFQGRYFGRSLAKLDWNRDGREDVCISHLDAPAALLKNTTTTTNDYLDLKLCGVMSNRDAIGAIVTVHAGQKQWTQHVVGGGGYFVANQRHLVFGLGETHVVDKLTIQWPSGLTQTLENVVPNQEMIVIEGGQWFANPARPAMSKNL